MSTPPPVGSIGLVRVRGLVGLLIRLGQWMNGDGFRNYEHAFVVVANDSAASEGGVWIVEAEPGGCHEVPLSKYSGRYVLWLECPAAYGPAVSDVAMTYRGIAYSAEDYLAMAAQRLHLRPVATRLKRDVIRSGHVICSQMADAAAQQGGWHLFNHEVWPGYITPAELAQLVPPGTVPVRIP